VSFLVDTGCERSVTPKKLVDESRIEQAECRLFPANGTVGGFRDAEIKIQNIIISVSNIIIPKFRFKSIQTPKMSDSELEEMPVINWFDSESDLPEISTIISTPVLIWV